MLYFFLLIQLMLFEVSIAIVAQTCIWRDGSIATNFLPCGNSTATTGSCCLSGESCLGSGLCYGSIGLVYRGACINTWGGDCPTYCDDVSDKWANFLPCPFANTGSADGPQSFWCGAMGTTVCTASNESHFITVLPQVATKILTSTSVAQATSSGSSSSVTPTSASTNSPQQQPSNCAVASNPTNNGTAIGLGVALGIVVLAWIGTGFWAYRSHRKQKNYLEHQNTSATYQYGAPPELNPKSDPPNYGNAYGVHRELPAGTQPTELDGGRAELGDR